MVNKIQKMRVTNMKARAWLKENGFKDIHLFPHTRWSKDVHLDGLEFDGIASLGTQIVLFQIKSNRKPTKETIEKYRKASIKYNALFLWITWIDRKGLRVYPRFNEK